MNSENLSEMKVSEKMEALKAKVFEEIKHDILSRGGNLPTEEELNQKVKVKYLGKMEFLNEKGELAEKDVFIVTEQLGGMFENLYYDEDLKLLGVQQMIGKEIYPTEYMLGKIPEKMKELTEEDIEEAKTIEEQKQEEQKQEPQQLPGLEEGIQFTYKEINSLNGPTIPLRKQFVDGDMTLENKIGVEGEYIKFVDIYEARKLHPELEIDELGQKFVPLVFSDNGKSTVATVVPEEKMRFSTIKGSNSTEKAITENNDGTRDLEQGIVTFEIPGTHNFITVGFNEQHTADPYYEVKFQTVDRDSNKLGGEELQQSYVGTIEDPTAHNERRINTEGQLKYTKELVTEEQAEKYAKAAGMFLDGRKLDLDRARQKLELLAVGGKSVNDVVQEAENEQNIPGPSDTRRPY